MLEEHIDGVEILREAFFITLLMRFSAVLIFIVLSNESPPSWTCWRISTEFLAL